MTASSFLMSSQSTLNVLGPNSVINGDVRMEESSGVTLGPGSLNIYGMGGKAEASEGEGCQAR